VSDPPAATRLVVLVRGINVGKAKQVAMTDLAGALAEIGGTDVRTYLRSGNAVMDVAHPIGPDAAAPGASPAGRTPSQAALSKLGAAAETALLARSGVTARVLVITADHLRAVATANPFHDLVATPKRLHVLFCETQPDPDLLAELGRRHGDDEIAAGDRVLYVAYRGGSSIDSPLAKVLPKLKITTTARNWSTVEALLRLCER
jgi:uncharacterized protein (DUF1697 family)